MPPAALRPDGIPASRVGACLGLLSDTHMPQRLSALPESLEAIFAGVDLILHAGDVGELQVLDRLGRIAPVAAVHGNDDSDEARRELPASLVLAAGGCRVLLTHSHHADREQEQALRREDAWAPKLARPAALGRSAGARVVVFGHLHVPLLRTVDGVLLVNPGALASPNPFTRQRIRSAALLYLLDDGTPLAVHVDLDAPGRTFEPGIDWGAGFRAAHGRFTGSILVPALEARLPELKRLRAIDPEALDRIVLRASRPCWAGERDRFGPAELLDALAEERTLPEPLHRALLALVEALPGDHSPRGRA